MTDVDQFIDQTGNDLVDAIARRRRRQLGIRRGAAGFCAAATGAVFVALIVSGLPGGFPDTALAITGDQSTVTVRVADAMADPATMTAELRAAGVNAQVQAEPVAATDVGHWIAAGTVGPASTADSLAVVHDITAQTQAHPGYLTVRKGLATTVSLFVGRPAAAGETPCSGGGAVVIQLNGGPCTAPSNARGTTP